MMQLYVWKYYIVQRSSVRVEARNADVEMGYLFCNSYTIVDDFWGTIFALQNYISPFWTKSNSY